MLAKWVKKYLICRDDAWGSYLTNGAGQITRRGKLTLEMLAQHFRAKSANDIIGLHMANCMNMAKSGALDIDQHGSDMIRAGANEIAAMHWYETLCQRGFHPLLTTSNGTGGFHLRILFQPAIEAGRVYRFLRELKSDHEKLGMAKPPEQFPKQEDVKKCHSGLGNWIRLPGRHHKRDYWSQVWNGSRWLSGENAVEFILEMDGDNPALVDHPKPKPKHQKSENRGQRSEVRVQTAEDSVRRHIEAYMRKLPNLGEGEGRDDVAFRFAAFLVRDMARPESEALDWLYIWDSRNNPPKGRERLVQIIKNATIYGRNPIGIGLRK